MLIKKEETKKISTKVLKESQRYKKPTQPTTKLTTTSSSSSYSTTFIYSVILSFMYVCN